MSNNDTFSGEGKKGEEELLDFDFEASSGEDVGNASGDFSSDEEILELVDIVEPAARDREIVRRRTGRESSGSGL
jgi:hypothetical protein